jgi:hypothetical protein
MAYEKKETAAPEATKSVEPVKAPKSKKLARLVWQSPKGPNCKTSLVTLQKINLENGRLLAFNEIKPNQCGQYALDPLATNHAEQVEAMESYAEKYGLYLIDPKMEGILPKSYVGMELPENNAVAVSNLQAELLAAQRANAELMKKLADAENEKA